MTNPAPLSAAQLSTLIAVGARELTWVLPHVSKYVSEWRQHALSMPASPLREDALTTLAAERFNIEGAALLATIPRRRNSTLLRLLVALEVMWDYLDTITERPSHETVRSGLQLHRALAEAFDPTAPLTDYYRFSPWTDDGDYLRTLVLTCRQLCAELPGYPSVRRLVVHLATQAQVSALNHEPDADKRDDGLREWAREQFPGAALPWFECTAAATSSVTIHALLALAAEPVHEHRSIARIYAAYFPWVNLLSTMLDSVADLSADAEAGAHSYIGHYGNLETATVRLRSVIRVAVRLTRELPAGHRHVLIPSGMAAMYLSDSSVQRSPELRDIARRILRAPGNLPLLLSPILRGWRRLALSREVSWAGSGDRPRPRSLL